MNVCEWLETETRMAPWKVEIEERVLCSYSALPTLFIRACGGVFFERVRGRYKTNRVGEDKYGPVNQSCFIHLFVTEEVS